MCLRFRPEYGMREGLESFFWGGGRFFGKGVEGWAEIWYNMGHEEE